MNNTQPQLSRDPAATQPLAGSISAVSWQHLSRDHAASQPWHLTATQPWLTAELRSYLVFYLVLKPFIRLAHPVFASGYTSRLHPVAACRRHELVVMAVVVPSRSKSSSGLMA